MENASNARSSADIEGDYRYSLERWWGSADEPITFVMLNPSTADATADDPTVRKCMGFAGRWGFTGLIIVNLFAYRTTDPLKLPSTKETAVGPRNNEAILAAASQSTKVVCAWGIKGRLFRRDQEVIDLLRPRHDLFSLGSNKDGNPPHPLYLPYNTALLPF